MVRSRSAKLQDGILLESLEEVRQRYFAVPCFIDIITMLVLLVYYVPGYPVQYVRLLFFLKVVNLAYYDKCFAWVLGVSSTKMAVYDLVKAGVYLFYFSNICAGIFFAVDYFYYAQKGLYIHDNAATTTGFICGSSRSNA